MTTENTNPFGVNWTNLEFNTKKTSQPQYPTSFTIMSNGQKKYTPMIYNTMNDKVFKFKFAIDPYDEQAIKQTRAAIVALGSDVITDKFDAELRKIQPPNNSTENRLASAIGELGLSAAQADQINAAQHGNTQTQLTAALNKLAFLESKPALKAELQQLNRVQVKQLVQALIEEMHLPICMPSPDLNFQSYEANYARSGIKVNLLFSEAKQSGADLGIIAYVPGAFVALHEHPGYEMVYVLWGDYIENGVTYTAGQMCLRGPTSFHSTASRTGCAILASRFRPVIQRPDLFNEFHQLRDSGEVDADGKRVGNPLEATETSTTIQLD